MVATFVTDPDEVPAGLVPALQVLFHLTPAEARLASALASGMDLREASRMLDIGRETARTQLRAVFAKTGTTRQADLVRTVVRALPVLPE